MGARYDDRRGKPLLDGARGEARRAPGAGELTNLADSETHGTELDVGRIDTTRQPLPSEMLRLPRAAGAASLAAPRGETSPFGSKDSMKRERGDGG